MRTELPSCTHLAIMLLVYCILTAWSTFTHLLCCRYAVILPSHTYSCVQNCRFKTCGLAEVEAVFICHAVLILGSFFTGKADTVIIWLCVTVSFVTGINHFNTIILSTKLEEWSFVRHCSLVYILTHSHTNMYTHAHTHPIYQIIKIHIHDFQLQNRLLNLQTQCFPLTDCVWHCCFSQKHNFLVHY